MASVPKALIPKPTPLRYLARPGDAIFRFCSLSAGLIVLALVGVFLQQLLAGAMPVFSRQGLAFVTSRDWDVANNHYGALPFVWGTLVSSLIALVIGGSVGVVISGFLVELAPRWLLKPIGFLVDMLAAIPSIIYGLWGVFVLIPWLRASVYPEISASLGWTGMFGAKGAGIPGTGLLTSGLVLAIMIIPTVAAITRELLLVVPGILRDGALALGANKTEALKKVQVPYAAGGILGALILGLGRALGETMAVTMVIGNSPGIHFDLFRPAASLSSVIANEFPEAGTMQRSALVALGLILFLLTLLLNFLARALVNHVRKKSGVAA